MKKLKLNELNRVKIDEYSKQEKFPVVIVLDNIRSAMNVGSFFRTADGFGIEKIYICGISACPPHKEISKTAIGADHSVDWEYVQDIYSCVFDLKDKGYIIIGIEQTDTSVYLNDFFPGRDQKYAFIFGNENVALYAGIRLGQEIAGYGGLVDFSIEDASDPEYVLTFPIGIRAYF